MSTSVGNGPFVPACLRLFPKTVALQSRVPRARNNAGMSKATHGSESACLAVPAAEVAKILGISVRHVWALLADGRLPKPVRLGRAVRWNVDELRDWLSAGAPDTQTWDEQWKSIIFGSPTCHKTSPMR